MKKSLIFIVGIVLILIPSFVSGVCGDGVCEVGENPITCNIDCFGRFSIAKEKSRFQEDIPFNQNYKNSFSELGATNWRTHIYWESVESTQGTYDWSYFENWLIPDVDNLIIIHPGLISGSGFWGVESVPSSVGGGWHDLPVRLVYEQNYIDFVKAAYTKANELTNGRAKIWQISSEVENKNHWIVPDGLGGEITDDIQRANTYVHLMELTYTALKEMDPNIIIIGCSHYGGWDNQLQIPKNYDFMATCLLQGKDYYDALDDRLYGLWEDIPVKFQWYNNFWNQQGIIGKRLYATEGGGPWTGREVLETTPGCDANQLDNYFNLCKSDLCPNPNDLSTCYTNCQNFCVDFESCINIAYPNFEKTKSEEIIKRYVLGFANNLDLFSWYKLPESPSKNFRECVLFVKGGSAPFFARMGLVNLSFNLKYPAFYTYQLAQDKLDYFVSVENLILGIDDYGYKFNFLNKNPVYVLWSETGASIDLSSYISKPNVKLTHIVTELDVDNNPIYLPDEIVPTNSIIIDETPVFIESCIHNADLNCDDVIDLTEIIDYIDGWKNNDVGVTISSLFDAFVIWKG